MRILHFSDIHITDDYDQNKVLQHFIIDINRHGKYDLVVCSGDIAAKGAFHNTNILNFFDSVKRVVGQETPIITCPGNHDMNLAKRKSHYKVNYESIKTYSDANSLFNSLDQDPDQNLMAHFQEYNAIASQICNENLENKIFFTKIIDVNGFSVGVASLNSVWFTRGGGDFYVSIK